MTSEALAFYDKHFGGVERFISTAGRRGIRGDAVLEACRQVYAQHLETPFRSNIVLGQRVLTLAQHLTVKKYRAARDETAAMRESHLSLEARVAALEHRHRPFFRKVVDFLETNLSYPYYG